MKLKVGRKEGVSAAIKATLVTCEDWEGLYFDGKLACQGHVVDLQDLINAADGRAIQFDNEVCADEAWLEGRGTLPLLLSDVVGK
jgi:hypothetical protein